MRIPTAAEVVKEASFSLGIGVPPPPVFLLKRPDVPETKAVGAARSAKEAGKRA